MSYSHDLNQIFEREGITPPQQLADDIDWVGLKERIIRELINGPKPRNGKQTYNRHLDKKFILDVCINTKITSAVKIIFPERLKLWNSVIFYKPPGGHSIPWHQDYQFLPVYPNLGVWVWLAITESSENNGALRFLPGSHKLDAPHLPRDSERQFLPRADLKDINLNTQQLIVGQPGTFAIIHNKTMHCSGPNLTPWPRIAMAIRFTCPGVEVVDILNTTKQVVIDVL